MVMDHECSVKVMAVEKYLLGEFGASERKAFERHYFECESCGEEVRLAFEFREIATSIFQEEPLPAAWKSPAASPRRWFAWLNPAVMAPLAASLAIAVWGGYQGLVEMPSLRARVQELNQPQAYQSTSVVPPSSRGDAPLVSRSAGPFLPLTLGIGVVPAAEKYECQVRSAAGKVRVRIQVPRLESDANLTLMIPASGMEPGRYDVVLLAMSGRNTIEIDHYPFVVRNQ
jgi:hypothetical protein